MTRDVKTLCPYCGVGCGLIATTDGKKILRVRPDPLHPANLGRICQKGATVAQTVNVSTRLRYPMIRETGSTRPQVVPVGQAIDHAATHLRRIIDAHGPQSVAFYLSGQLQTEAQYLAAKFARACLRTPHVDSNSRLCMSSAASGMNLSLGSDGPPTCYADIELADTFLFVGSNAAECHPVTFERVKARIDKNRAECIVVDPRRTLTAEAAHLHIPAKPGTDLALLNGLLHLLRERGRLDRAFVEAHTEGWAELDAMLDQYSPQWVATICSIDESLLQRAADILGQASKLITFWTMGANQSIQGTFNTNAICNLHLALGQIGRPGCGPFSLTGQPNAMGGRDCGYMGHTLPGYRFVADADHRQQMESFWGLSPGHLPSQVGYDAVRMFDALSTGELKAIWIIGSNPAATMPRLSRVRDGLERAELVIVQDAYYPTETSRFAHVLFPGAVNLESEGTYCNSERCVTLMQPVAAPPGDAKPDWWWVRETGRALGFEKGIGFQTAEEIFDEFARSTAGRPNDQSGLYHKLLREKGPQQWPFPLMGKSTARRYQDFQFHRAGGRAKFWARPHLDNPEQPTAQFPLLLTTGRVIGQWHTRTKTGTVTQLNNNHPSPFLQMHPEDATTLGLEDGQRVAISSPRGRAFSQLKLEQSISPGVVFSPIHWNDLWARSASPNEATSDDVDPISKQPNLKCCIVNVTPDECVKKLS